MYMRFKESLHRLSTKMVGGSDRLSVRLMAVELDDGKKNTGDAILQAAAVSRNAGAMADEIMPGSLLSNPLSDSEDLAYT